MEKKKLDGRGNTLKDIELPFKKSQRSYDLRVGKFIFLGNEIYVYIYIYIYGKYINICGKHIYAHTHIYGKDSKIWSVLNANMIPQVENSPPDFVQWVVAVVEIQVCSKFRTQSSPGYMFQGMSGT